LARGEVKLYEDHLVSASGLKTKHLRLLLNDFSIIVPMLGDHRLVFEWNYRHALEGWELELPAGLIEDGEMPLEAAQRELHEETGYIAGRWKQVGWIHTLPGITGQRVHVFLAKELRRGRANREPVEMMRIQNISLGRAYRLLHEGKIVHAPTVVALSLAETMLRT
jgi:ADP-ribose pyrophosphatase